MSTISFCGPSTIAPFLALGRFYIATQYPARRYSERVFSEERGRQLVQIGFMELVSLWALWNRIKKFNIFPLFALHLRIATVCCHA